jgi:hypothetical protein
MPRGREALRNEKMQGGTYHCKGVTMFARRADSKIQIVRMMTPSVRKEMSCWRETGSELYREEKKKALTRATKLSKAGNW